MPPEMIEAPAERVAAPKTQKTKSRKMLHMVLYVAGGALAGFAYHKLIGCRSGSCPITANPYISTLYGALIGFFAGGGLGR